MIAPFLPHGRRAFTLIELLVVIAIIGILAAILIPTVGAVRTSAKRAETKVRFGQWAAAMEQFKQDYGYYPAITTSNLLDPTKFLAALNAHDYTGTALTGTALNGNTRAIAFYSPADAELVKDAAGATINQLCDPFGNSDVAVLIDANGDGIISGTELVQPSVRAGNSMTGQGTALTPDADNFPSTGIRAGVLFYSAGPGVTSSDLVYSWK